ncbi:MAG: hypothetical protein ACTSWN_17375 [Promethearchaeota archaeon]
MILVILVGSIYFLMDARVLLGFKNIPSRATAAILSAIGDRQE